MSNNPPAPNPAATICVASKLPFPLRLELQRSTARMERDSGGEHRVESFVKTGKFFIIDGCARPVNADSEKHLVGGFALTHGVDAEFWAEWVKQNQGCAPLDNGLIFAASKSGYVADKAKEMKGLRSGFEPVDPKNLPKEFVSVTEAA